MIKLSFRYNIVYYLLVIIVATFLLPTVSYFVPESVLLFIIILFIVAYYPKKLFFSSILYFFIFVALLLFENNNPNKPSIYNLGVIVPSYGFMFVWLMSNRFLKKEQIFELSKLMLVLIFITIGVSLMWGVVKPNLLRDISVFGDSKTTDIDEQNAYYRMLGLMTYGFAHAVPLVLPALIVMAKLNYRKLNVYYVLSALIIVTLFLSGVTTSAFIGLFIAALSILISIRKNSIKKYTIILVLFLIYLIFGNTIIIWFLELIQPLFRGFLIEQKITSILNVLYFASANNELTLRASLHQISWNTFFQYPFFGSHNWSVNSIGGHSFLGDSLAYWGIFGFLPFVLIVVSQAKLLIKSINRILVPYYLLSITYYIILAYMKGTPSGEMYLFLFFILPVFYKAIDYKYYYVRR